MAHRRCRGLAILLTGLVGFGLTACSADQEGDDADREREPPRAEVVAPDPGSRAGGTLRVGLVLDPVSIDPRFVVDDEGELIVDALFDPLVRLDGDGEPIPAAAVGFEVDGQGTRFTFHLREARFHDGSPVTAADFKRTFDWIADGTAEPRSFLAYLVEDIVGADTAMQEGGPLRGVTAVDERTLEIELDEPQPGYLATLANPSLVPTPPVAEEDAEDYGQEPIGNGAFAMAGPREPGAFVRLTAVEDHPSAALLDEVLFTIYPDDEGGEQQWDDLQEGQLHVGRIPADRRSEVEARFGESVDGYRGPGLIDGVSSSAYLYGFNVTEEPFDDPRLRRALSLAIDRESLAEDLLDGTREPATSIVPPPFPGSQPGACEHCRHDPFTAVQLLDEVVDDLAAEEADAAADADDDATGDAGSDAAADADDDATGDAGSDAAADADDDAAGGAEADDTDDDAQPAADEEGGGEESPRPVPAELIGRIQLLHNRGVTHTAIAEQLADDIERVLGLEVDFQAIGLQPFIRSVRAGDVPVFRMGWDVSGPDVDGYLWPLFHSSQIGRDNLTRYEDPEVDELLERARATGDAERRIELYQRAEQRILRDAPAIPVLWDRHRLAIAPEVRGLEVSPFGRLSLAEAWLDADR